ncbi:MAG: hypothetical protein KAU28_08835, partial [Phycisphaerae bacterium]|nr:hypothetical protein [Phycisphaerae bacterium]
MAELCGAASGGPAAEGGTTPLHMTGPRPSDDDCTPVFGNRDPVQTVLDRLAGMQPAGRNNWRAFCPVHENPPNGHKRSLSVKRADDGKVLICCHAGCPNDAIVKAIGLTLADLNPAQAGRPQTNGKTKGRVVVTYDYCDSTGRLLFQVVRYHPKDFRQRRPDGNGGWLWNLDHTPRVLYRLPELLAADPTKWVFVDEGEKDADNVAAIGLVATTNPGGAGKWKHLCDDSALYGRCVAIIADKDRAGFAHAQDVAARLHGKAAVVKVINLPDGEVDG